MAARRLEIGKTYYCPYCAKPVRHKRFVGTMHVCLTSEERRAINNAKMAEQQRVAFGGLDRLMSGPYPSISSPPSKD